MGDDVTVWCGVYEVGSVFRLKIARHAYVDELQQAIVDSRKTVNPRFNVDPTEVTLYLAKKKDGTWLSSDAASVAFLQRGRQQDAEDDYVRMIPNWKLSKKAYFGRNFQRKEDGDEEEKHKEDEQDEEDEEDEDNEEIHILVQLPAVESVLTTAPDGLWRVYGWVSEALNTIGIRSRLYKLAGQYLGYYDPVRHSGDNGDCAFWYEGTTLCVQVLFKSCKGAERFDRVLMGEPRELFSPLNGHVVTTRKEAAAEVPRTATLTPIYHTDYDPRKSQSPAASISSTSSVTVLDGTNELFRYQRIEHEKYFLPFGKAESCHLVSKKRCLANKRNFGKFNNDPNNRLALSRDMHGFFDGLVSELPIITMRPGAVDERPSIDNRYKVEVFVTVYEANCKDRVFYRLKDGSTQTDDPLTMKTAVYVEDPTTFCFCMEHKHRETQAVWSTLGVASSD